MNFSSFNFFNYLPLLILYIFMTGSLNDAFSQESAENSSKNRSTSMAKYTETDTSIVDSSKSYRTWEMGWFPVIFYSNETEFGVGGGVQWVKSGYTKRHSSSMGVIGYFTQNNQYAIIANKERFFKQGIYRIAGEIAYHYFPDKFYGIGNNTVLEDEEDFTSQEFRFNPLFQRILFSSSLYVGFHYDYYYSEIVDTEPGKILDSGTITGSEGGLSSGIGLDITWDTRDNNLYPSNGSLYQLIAGFYGPTLGSDFSFSSYLLDLRQYISIFSGHVLALREIVGVNTGDPPFQMLFFTGSLGYFLRGYTISRFMDKNIIAFQTEYRLPLIWRFGLVAFAGFGQVAPEFNQVSINDLKPSVGLGLRFALIPEQKVNLRIDFGIGKDDSSFNIDFMEAF